MTPAKQARQIDQDEFQADCIASRHRAFAFLEALRHAEANKLKAWMQSNDQGRSKKRSRSTNKRHQAAVEKAGRVNAAKAKQLVAFDRAQSLKQWAKETGLSEGTIRSRLKYGWTLEDALSKNVQVHRKRGAGVPSEFPELVGTGAGKTVQKNSNLAFSEETPE